MRYVLFLILCLAAPLGAQAAALPSRDVPLEDLILASSGRIAVYAQVLGSEDQVSVNGAGARFLGPLIILPHAAALVDHHHRQGQNPARAAVQIVAEDARPNSPGSLQQVVGSKTLAEVLTILGSEDGATARAALERHAAPLLPRYLIGRPALNQGGALRTESARLAEFLRGLNPRFERATDKERHLFAVHGSTQGLIPRVIQQDPRRHQGYVRSRQSAWEVMAQKGDRLSPQAVCEWWADLVRKSDQAPGGERLLLRALQTASPLDCASLVPAHVTVSGFQADAERQTTSLCMVRAEGRTMVMLIDVQGYVSQSQRRQFHHHLGSAIIRRLMPGRVTRFPQVKLPHPRAFRGAIFHDLKAGRPTTADDRMTFRTGSPVTMTLDVAPESQSALLSVRWLLPNMSPVVQRQWVEPGALHTLNFTQTPEQTGTITVEVALDGTPVLAQSLRILHNKSE